jgi:DNA-binding GntR family transcriptional regulator
MPRRITQSSAATKTKLAKSQRGAVQDRVIEKLRTGLMVGALVPGQVMSLRKLASSLGTSAMPVRTALMQLVAAGALEELPNRSVRVPRLSRTRLEELFRIRELLEGMAAQMACDHVTPELINRLRKINKELLTAIEKRDIHTSLRVNQQFHFTLYAAAQAQILVPLIESLWLQCGPALYFSALSTRMPWDATSHIAILAALRKRKPALVQAAVVHDVRTTAKILLIGVANAMAKTALAEPLHDPHFS